MTTTELIDAVARAGGVLKIERDGVRCWLPIAAAHLASQLRERKPEVVSLLRMQGGRVATFPHCPRCASYALYRQHNEGKFECQTCGLQNIEEHIARRLM